VKVIVGLGNPGPKYRNTRHNLGFVVLDLLAEQLRVASAREKSGGLVSEGLHVGERVMLVKPLTFMNRSGDCVAPLVRNKVDSLEDVLVITDDVNLPLGKLRLRPGGSAGGHNGLKSLIERLGSQEFPRVRMGVGQSGGRELADHVLSRFHPDEGPEVDRMVKLAAEAALCFVAQGIEKAMNQFN
jgi:PTH1 family peptidyl-tRNA hydrolase